MVATTPATCLGSGVVSRWTTAALALALTCHAALAHGTPPIRINELMVNPLGADIGQEFIEISGPPGASLAGLSIVVIEGDATSTSATQKGRIDNVIAIGSHSIGDSGLFLLRDGPGMIDCDPGPEVLGAWATTRVVVLSSTASVSGLGNGPLGLENSSSTILLVSGFAGAAGQDLDSNNDGILDAQPWTAVIDALGMISSSSGPLPQSVSYANALGGTTLSRMVTGFDIAMAARASDGTWITAPVIGVNPTTGPPTLADSGPYFWLPDREHPAIAGTQYRMTPGQPNGPIPNTDEPCGSLRVMAVEGTNALWSTWGYPTFELAGSPVQFEVPPGGSIRQAVGAAVRVRFVAPAAARYRMDLCASAIPDTVMVALDACGDAYTAFAANDDSAACGADSNRSALDIDLQPGEAVELAVGSFMTATDTFPLETGSMSLRIRRDSDSDGLTDDEDGCPQAAALAAPMPYVVDADLDGYGGPVPALLCATAAPDGYASAHTDCDDTDPAEHPGAPELCDGQDDDCDGQVDEGVTSAFYSDSDGDGAGDPAASVQACAAPAGYVANALDECPAEGALVQPVTYYADADGDGYGLAPGALCSVAPPAGWSAFGGDCNASAADAYPGAAERCPTVGVDNDCDGDVTDVTVPDVGYRDADGDGFGAGPALEACPLPDGYSQSGGDCDDADASRRPLGPEACDDVGIDNDCDGDALELTHPRTYWRDADGDGAGDPAVPVQGCTAPDGYVGNASDDCPADPALIDAVLHHVDADGDSYGAAATAGHCSIAPPPGFAANGADCDDGRTDVYPSAAELCASYGRDNDCDGDAYDATDLRTFYLDLDGDQRGDDNATTLACTAPPGYVPVGGDGCPLNPFAQAPVRWYRDADIDMFGNPQVFILSCVQPAGHIPQSTDCDDTRAWVNPGAPELCDTYNRDEDCDGAADDADSAAGGKVPWFVDADGDGYGAGAALAACDPPSASHVRPAGDCNDSPAGGGGTYPGAPELCATAMADNDCDGDAYETDPFAADRTDFYSDVDDDGAGDPAVSVRACLPPTGFVANASDECPADGALVEAPEYYADADGDGFGSGIPMAMCTSTAPDGYASAAGDCNDADAAGGGDSYPGAAELCATPAVDNDCDGDAYEADPDASDRIDFYGDADGDGAGDPASVMRACTAPDGYVGNGSDQCPGDGTLVAAPLYLVDADDDGYGAGGPVPVCASAAPDGYATAGGDCNDSPAGGAGSYPGAPEACVNAGMDNDCDGDVYDIDPDAYDWVDFYGDADGDGAGDPAVVLRACTAPDGYVANASDQCPGSGALASALPYFADADGDGYGAGAAVALCAITAPDGYSSAGTDCNDVQESGGAACFPGADELCASVGTDNDCDGDAADVDADASDRTPYFADADGDGYGAGAAVALCAGSAPSGYAAQGGDCSESDAYVNPGAPEACNGVDDNCSGSADDGLAFVDYYADADGDGYGDSATATSACAPPAGAWVAQGGDNCVAIANPSQADCDADGIGDACEIAAGAPDCDASGTPDACDIASGAASDVDGNGVPDSCTPDCNSNGVPDAWETLQDPSTDCNVNSVPDECEDGTVRADTGPLGPLAAGSPVTATLTGQERATTPVQVRIEVRGDFDGSDEYLTLALNGLAFGGEILAAGGSACPEGLDVAELELSIADWLQVTDAAAAPGAVAVALAASDAVDASACAAASVRVRIRYGGAYQDCDMDGYSDMCQLASGQGDCDGNGTYDACEAGGAGDSDDDGTPDSCERARGDLNLDGAVDGLDLAIVLSAWGAFGNAIADINGDGTVDGADLTTLLAGWGDVTP